MITEDEVRALSAQERHDLTRLLLTMEAGPVALPRRIRRERFAVRTIAALAVAVLIGWSIFLTQSLPTSSVAHGWRTTWVGLDTAEAVALTVTAWAAWRERHVLVPAAIVGATLLLCDAWFDVSLSWGSSSLLEAILSAVLLEIPLAGLLLTAAYEVVRMTVIIARARVGVVGPSPRLRDLPLNAPLELVAATSSRRLRAVTIVKLLSQF